MNPAKRKINTEYYNYINVNPFGKYAGDCVIRAVALMTNMSWAETIHQLTNYGITKGFICNDEKCFTKYLEKSGWVAQNEPRDIYNKKITVREFIQIYPDIECVAIVGSHHVTAIKDGKVQDIWDCSNQTMHRYWTKKE